MTFEQLLVRVGMRKSELARRLGVHRNTVSAWGEKAPEYAMAYLRALVELMRYRP